MPRIIRLLLISVTFASLQAGHSFATENTFDVRFVAQDKITFETDKTVATVEASSTYDGKDVQTDQATEGK